MLCILLEVIGDGWDLTHTKKEIKAHEKIGQFTRTRKNDLLGLKVHAGVEATEISQFKSKITMGFQESKSTT